jgi:tRNA(His) 5'-end guanylyltransferase
MKFDVLDGMMRVYETCNDYSVIPNMYMIARLDGKGFTKLTKRLNFEKPFDIKFSNIMRKVTHHLMENTGIKFTYGYTQSDEISLLFHINEDSFARKLRKLNSTLAGYASAIASLELNEPVVFDCRISQLPNKELVYDYFSWRQEDANRNALIGYCYWTLRDQGCSAHKATSIMNGINKASQNELLFDLGINYNNVEEWHKRGVGFYFESYIKEGWNPILKETTFTTRSMLVENERLPIKEDYRFFIKRLLNESKNLQD